MWNPPLAVPDNDGAREQPDSRRRRRRRRVAAPREGWLNSAFNNRLMAVVLAMVIVIPLVGAPSESVVRGIAPFIFEAFAILLATMLLWDGELEIDREKVVRFLRTGANLPVLLLTGWTVALSFFVPYKSFAIQSVIQLFACVLLYFVVAYQFREAKQLGVLTDVLLFLAAAMSLAAVVHYTLSPLYRGRALFGNQQLLGSMLMILLPLILSVAFTTRSPRRQLAAQAAAVLTAGALLLAQTRSAWLGAVTGIVIMALAYRRISRADGKRVSRKTRVTSRKHRAVMPLVVVLVVAGLFGAVLSQNRAVARRAMTLSSLGDIGSLQDRRQIWRGTMRMIGENPVTGVGPGLYPVFQYDYTGYGMRIMSGEREVGIVSLATQAHNFYLQAAAETGLPGLLLVVAILLVFLVAAFRHVAGMEEGIRRTLLLGCLGSVAAFAVDAMSNPSWQFGQIVMYFWLVMGIGLNCLLFASPQKKRKKRL